MEQGGHHQNPGLGFEQQAHLPERFFAAANNDDLPVLQINEYGEIAHGFTSAIGHEFDCETV
jgi:hypothetical protein